MIHYSIGSFLLIRYHLHSLVILLFVSMTNAISSIGISGWLVNGINSLIALLFASNIA